VSKEAVTILWGQCAQVWAHAAIPTASGCNRHVDLALCDIAELGFEWLSVRNYAASVRASLRGLHSGQKELSNFQRHFKQPSSASAVIHNHSNHNNFVDE
jgi:hypothetical protein